MRKLSLLTALLFVFSVAKAEEINFDFDGKDGQKANLVDASDPSETKDNIIERKIFMLLDNGTIQEVMPSEYENGKAYYKLKPNTKFYGQYKCISSNPSLTYKACETYKFYPEYSGHNHNGNIPPYTDWNGQQLTNPVCTPVTYVNNYSYIYFKTPEFATRIEHETNYYGSCSGTYYI